MTIGVTIIFVVGLSAAWIGAPVSLFSGWRNFKSFRRNRGPAASIAFFGFLLANVSTLLAFVALLHGRWAFYDPLLMRIYGWGMLLSTAGLIASLAVIWKRSAFQWQAPLACLGTLMFWFLAAAGE